jgi:predicted secreted acid phosphatase
MNTFNTMEQRIVNMYLELFPEFKAAKSHEISESAQEQFYNFIKSIFFSLSENPLLLFTKTNPDDFFTRRFNKRSENKQEAYNKMKKNIKTLEEFSQCLFDLGKNSSMETTEDRTFILNESYKIPKRYLNVLNQCGLEYTKTGKGHVFKHKESKELLDCWKWFSSKPDVTLPHFIACMFDIEHPYTSEIYSKLSGNKELYETLESFLIKNNYQRMDNRDNKVCLDYIKSYDKKDTIIKEAWGERTHGGIGTSYDPLMQNPPLFSLRVPYYKKLLEQFDRMNDELKSFVTSKGKKCDNCRYCVQTDKTGKRELAFIAVEHQQKYAICTYFPGFSYCWTQLDQANVNGIIGLLTFADEVLRT